MIKKFNVLLIIVFSIFLIFSTNVFAETNSTKNISTKNSKEDFKIIENSSFSKLFRVYAYQKDIVKINGTAVALDVQFELKSGMSDIYSKLGFFNQTRNSVVILPIFTSSAYYEKGFYDFYNKKCNNCVETSIKYEKPLRWYSASQNAAKIFKILNYDVITDIDVDKNPKILKKYDKVILLHNEYVTQKEFNAITSHPKVIYLYPNALYAKIDVNYDKNSITLVKGHGYPEKSIGNGFNWKFDNTNPFEYDNKCLKWSFTKIDNGMMLNCYPEYKIITDDELLRQIKKY